MLRSQEKQALGDRMDAMITAVVAAVEILGDHAGPYAEAIANTLSKSMSELHTVVAPMLNGEG